MSLTVLEKLELQDQLADLLIQQPTTSGLQMLELLEAISTILERLGYALETATPAPTDEPGDQIPQLVADYKQGVYRSVNASAFIETLRELEQFVPTFITLEEVIAGAVDWVTQNQEKVQAAA